MGILCMSCTLIWSDVTVISLLFQKQRLRNEQRKQLKLEKQRRAEVVQPVNMYFIHVLTSVIAFSGKYYFSYMSKPLLLTYIILEFIVMIIVVFIHVDILQFKISCNWVSFFWFMALFLLVDLLKELGCHPICVLIDIFVSQWWHHLTKIASLFVMDLASARCYIDEYILLLLLRRLDFCVDFRW